MVKRNFLAVPARSKRLRARANAITRPALRDIAGMPAAEVQQLVQALQIHQLELEIQNEDLRAAQVELAESEETLRHLNETLEQRVADQTREVRLLAKAISHLGEGVLITRDHVEWPGPEIVFVNEALCRITGFPAEELIGQTPRILHGNVSNRKVMAHVRHELAAGRSCLAETINYRKDGTPYDAEVYITPLCDAAGNRTHFVSIHRDISERKRAERALRSSEERMRSVLKTAISAIITIDQKCVIESVNPAAEKMFGYAAAEMVGQNVKILMPSPYREQRDSYLQRFLHTGHSRTLAAPREVVAQRKDGTTFPADVSVTEVGHLGIYTGIIHDISQRKELQKHILEIAAEEQRRIGQELHDGTGQELTGLSLIAGSLLDRLTAVPATQAKGKTVHQLDEADFAWLLKNVAKLVEKISDSHRNVQQLSHGIMPVQIDAEGLRSALQELADSNNIAPHIACRFLFPAPVAFANNTTATHLFRIAQEAVNNAVRHSRADEITISLCQQGSQIVLEVTDNGIGIDAVDSLVHGEHKAHGMGLRTMQYRCGMIGGTCQIEPRKPRGTSVKCVLLSGGIPQ